jgi:hypothetical protein
MAFDTLYVPVLAALAGGGLVTATCALVQLRPTKKKLDLEVKRLELEIKNLSEQTAETKNLSIQTAYAQSGAMERVLFDTSVRMDGFQIEGGGQREGDFDEQKQAAQGEFLILNDSVLEIKRTNVEGRYSVILREYAADGQMSKVVASDPTHNSQRRIRVSFLARAIGGDHTLRTVLKINRPDGKWLDGEREKVIPSGEDWTRLDWYFHVTPHEEWYVRIDDRLPSAVPSSVQIKAIVVSEKLA